MNYPPNPGPMRTNPLQNSNSKVFQRTPQKNGSHSFDPLTSGRG